MKEFTIMLAPNRELAETIDAVASVEAEYGDYCVEGRRVTLAHHGSRSHNPAPCNTPGVPVLDGGTILVSHLDLDAAGGVFALMGEKIEDEEFWSGAERIDVSGLHHMHELSQDVQNKLNAYYAWKDNLPRIRYTEITDVTEEFLATRDALGIILDEKHPKHQDMIDAGIAWEQASRERVESKLIGESEYVRCFVTDGVFCAAAYFSPKYERIVPATVVCNTVYRSITVAFADGGKRLSAREIVQSLWGPEAGGHNGIAGSPRSWNVDEETLMAEYEKCRERVEKLVKEKTFNILVNNISFIKVQRSKKNAYSFSEVEIAGGDKETIIKDYFTNEPVTHMLISQFANADNGNRLDHIISFASQTVCEKQILQSSSKQINYDEKKEERDTAAEDKYLSEILENSPLSNDEKGMLTSYGYYEASVQNMVCNEHLKDWQEAKAMMPNMEAIEISDSPDGKEIYKATVEMAEKIIKDYEDNGYDNCCLYMDYTGGDRSASTLMISLTKMLEIRNIHVNHIYAVNFNDAAEVKPIKERKTVNYVFDFISGLNEFINYGRAELLIRFFEESVDSGDIVLSEKAKKVLDNITKLAESMQLCQAAKIEDRIGTLVKSIEAYKSDIEENKEPVFDYLIHDIERNYASIYQKENRTTLRIIEWCLDKGMIQQALTIYTELLPVVLVKNYVQYKNRSWFLNLKGASYNSNYDYSFIVGFLGNEYLDEKIKENKRMVKAVVKKLKDDKELDCKLWKGAAKFEKAFANYRAMKEIRNMLNHASDRQISISEKLSDFFLKDLDLVSKKVDGTPYTEISVEFVQKLMKDVISQMHNDGVK